uniref:Uncharacterized protein n=1 Tax=Anguilla anguilla TaxID=7936 RepID=A0A0E9SWR5_ANGAN
MAFNYLSKKKISKRDRKVFKLLVLKNKILIKDIKDKLLSVSVLFCCTVLL